MNKSQIYFGRIKLLITGDGKIAEALRYIKLQSLMRYEISEDGAYIYKYLTEDETLKEYNRPKPNWVMSEIGFTAEFDCIL